MTTVPDRTLIFTPDQVERINPESWQGKFKGYRLVVKLDIEDAYGHPLREIVRIPASDVQALVLLGMRRRKRLIARRRRGGYIYWLEGRAQ